MRLSLPLALALLLAAPASAQLSFSPLAGYDIDAEAPTIGLAFELGTSLASLPLSPAIRPSVEYGFLDGDASLIRVDGDLIGRIQAGQSFLPYAKAGVTVEYVDFDGGSNTEVGLNLGGGAEFSRLFVEGAFGIGDISDLRVRAGYRF